MPCSRITISSFAPSCLRKSADFQVKTNFLTKMPPRASAPGALKRSLKAAATVRLLGGGET